MFTLKKQINESNVRFYTKSVHNCNTHCEASKTHSDYNYNDNKNIFSALGNRVIYLFQ